MADDVLVWSPTLDPPAPTRLSLKRLAVPLLRAVPILLVLTVAGIAHGYNMFGSPFYFDDEGIYMSQAWSFITSGELAPYTYFYDHPPIGWFTIGFMIKVLGGFGAFGASVNAGRMVMFLVHLASTLLVYRITRRLGGSEIAGLAAALLFGLSPFQILFGRQVLLDNLAAFWLLVSLYFATSNRLSVWGALFSGLAMGIAVLSKEIIGPMIPGMLVFLWLRLHRDVRFVGIATWVFTAFALGSFYPLYALLKGELFPYGSPFDFASRPHVSLIDGVMFHQNRASDLGLFDMNSLFWNAERLWWRTDPALVVALIGAIVMSVLLRDRYRGVLGFGVMLVSLLAFLARGGVVFEFWLLVAIPIALIMTGLTIGHALETVTSVTRSVLRPPTAVFRELYRDFRRMRHGEITDREFVRIVGIASRARTAKVGRFFKKLVPSPVRTLGNEYRGMLRGDLSEGQFFANIGRGVRRCVLAVLSLPWTAQDILIRWSELAVEKLGRVFRGRTPGDEGDSGPGLLTRSLAAGGAVGLTAALVLTVVLGRDSYARSYERAFTNNETGPQVDVIDWFQSRADQDDFLVIDTYAYVDLQGFDNAHPFWKVDLDPDVRDDVLRGSWRGIDYVALTPVMNSAVADGRLPLVAEALDRSCLLIRFESGGEWVEIHEVRPDLPPDSCERVADS